MSNNKSLNKKEKIDSRVDEEVKLYFQRKSLLHDRSISYLVAKALKNQMNLEQNRDNLDDIIMDIE